jgi:hypothetical protein
MRSYPEFWKGADTDRSMLRRLPRLPETAAELRVVAKNLGAPETSIHLRQDASETTVKRTALSEYRVVYFATHGLVAGDIKGLAEPLPRRTRLWSEWCRSDGRRNRGRLGGIGRRALQHDDLGSYLDPAIEIRDVFVGEPDTSR